MGAPGPMPNILASLRRALLSWYRRHARTLPWRDHPTPYRVWVSEIMLQQTQVATVLGYFERFIARFPELAALAKADESEVLALWEGLGYYRRARMLHAAARQLVASGGDVPSRFEDLLLLPGLGRYTAAAIASIAHGEPVAVLDGNVRRVLSRLRGRRDWSERQIWQAAEQLLDREAPGEFNQAMMELGATVCLPKAPLCLVCPWKDDCRARTLGHPEQFPTPKQRPVTVHVHEHAVALHRRGRWLLARRDDGERYRQMWELPRCTAPLPVTLLNWIRETLGLSVEQSGEPHEVSYPITHHRVRMTVHTFDVIRGRPRRGPYADIRWFDPAAMEGLPMSAPMRRALRLLEPGDRRRESSGDDR